MDRGKVPQCPETGTKFTDIPAFTDVHDIGNWFVVGGSFTGTSLVTNGDFTVELPTVGSIDLTVPEIPDLTGEDGGGGGGDTSITLTGGTGTDTIEGAGAVDSLSGLEGDDTLVGAEGDDALFGGNDDDVLFGGSDNDTLYGGKGNDDIYGGTGNDLLFSGDHTSTLDGGEGDDHIVVRMNKNVSHVITGGTGADVFQFVYPSNTVSANAKVTDFEDGVDLLQIDGVFSMSDLTLMDTDDGLVISFNDDETLTLEGVQSSELSEDDFIWDTEFDNSMTGSDGDDALTGTNGSDKIIGGDGNDTLYGGKGDDLLIGGKGDDVIYGNKQNNTIEGGLGNDMLYTGANTSTVDGGLGDDLIVASMLKNSAHVLTGGSGADTFEFAYVSNKKTASATITDFEIGTDLLKIAGVASLADLTLTDTDNGVEIGFNDNETIVLNNITAAQITDDQFVFI